MGRRYRRRSYQRRERKPVIWTPCPIVTPINPDSATPPKPQNVVKGTTYKVCDVSIDPNAETEVVLERIRGTIFWEATASSGTSIQATIFGIILPKIVAGKTAVGKELGDFPHPMKADGVDDFPLVMDACAPQGGGITSSSPIPVDVKSKRRMGKDELLTLAIHIGDIFTTGVNPTYKAVIRGGLRILQKIL